MLPSHRQRILEALWPPAQPQWRKICVVLDAARDERIFTAVERCTLDKCCLYAGAIPWVLQRAAPYLVVLDPDDRFTRQIIDEGWGNSWGIFLRTDAHLLEVRRHLRSLLKVKTESGSSMLFRWYDPRVLRPFLPTCQPDELKTFCGPVDCFYAEGADPDTLLQFQYDGRDLRTRTRSLAGAGSAG